MSTPRAGHPPSLSAPAGLRLPDDILPDARVVGDPLARPIIVGKHVRVPAYHRPAAHHRAFQDLGVIQQNAPVA